MQMLQDLQWDGCRKETDYYEKSYGSRKSKKTKLNGNKKAIKLFKKKLKIK